MNLTNWICKILLVATVIKIFRVSWLLEDAFDVNLNWYPIMSKVNNRWRMAKVTLVLLAKSGHEYLKFFSWKICHHIDHTDFKARTYLNWKKRKKSMDEIAFFLFSFLEKQKKFFSNEKNRKNRYEWRFEAWAKRMLQISHEYNGF